MPASTLHYGAPEGGGKGARRGEKERERERERGQGGPADRGREGATESGRVDFYSPRARYIVYPKNTLRAHAIARHAAFRRGESTSLRRPLSPTSSSAIDIRDRDRGAMRRTSSVSMNVRMDNAITRLRRDLLDAGDSTPTQFR